MGHTKHKLIRERYKNCLICNVPLERPNFQRKYCSTTCYNIGARRRQRANQARYKQDPEYMKKRKEYHKRYREIKRNTLRTEDK